MYPFLRKRLATRRPICPSGLCPFARLPVRPYAGFHMTGSIIDMHMHTVLGAYDSSLKPDDLATEAVRVGLTGVNISEHDRLWDRYTLDRFRTEKAPLFSASRPRTASAVEIELCRKPLVTVTTSTRLGV